MSASPAQHTSVFVQSSVFHAFDGAVGASSVTPTPNQTSVSSSSEGTSFLSAPDSRQLFDDEFDLSELDPPLGAAVREDLAATRLMVAPVAPEAPAPSKPKETRKCASRKQATPEVADIFAEGVPYALWYSHAVEGPVNVHVVPKSESCCGECSAVLLPHELTAKGEYAACCRKVRSISPSHGAELLC